MIDEKTPSWGIEPVPQRLRVLGVVDTMLLWGNLSVSLLVIVLGAVLVPALSLRDALIAIVVGAVAGNVLLGLAGLIGADARVPGMVVLRAPLGRRGSYAPTVVNVAQNLGWSTFELIVISTAAAALSKKVFGFEGRWLWALLFGLVAVALALLGPIGFVRRYVRKFAVWAVLASMIYLTWWVLLRSRGRLLRTDALVLRPGHSARPLSQRHRRGRRAGRRRRRRGGQRLRAARSDRG
ncbi:MAG: hypothetical protein E6G25_08345 [Actinobacteria bacterium]|nr:MAG: hypothetical protein E6G25_08345 [Actinomycetota bacterium]